MKNVLLSIAAVFILALPKLALARCEMGVFTREQFYYTVACFSTSIIAASVVGIVIGFFIGRKSKK